MAMRGFSGMIAAAACLALGACSSPPPEEPKKAAAAPKKETAPDIFVVHLDTSKGPVEIEVHRDWAPIGADHFYTLVKLGFYDGTRFFRVVRNYVVQFGINGDPKNNRLWSSFTLADDPVKQRNRKGTLTYAMRGPHSRSTQLFINLKDNLALDKDGFAPIGKVTGGMDVVESFYNSYGDMPPRGQGPDATQIEIHGNEYLQNRFPRLDYIRKAVIQ
jgi:peptidyl-prolyl cis-trans isomerase A (cyclophilin A)